VRESECRELLQNFFADQRARQKAESQNRKLENGTEPPAAN